MNIEEAINKASAFGGCIFNNELSFDRAMSLSKTGPLSIIDSNDGFTGNEIISDNWGCYRYSETAKRPDYDRGKFLSLYEALLKCKAGETIYNDLRMPGPVIIYGSEQLGPDVFVYRYYPPLEEMGYVPFWRDEIAMFTPYDIYNKTWTIVELYL